MTAEASSAMILLDLVRQVAREASSGSGAHQANGRGTTLARKVESLGPELIDRGGHEIDDRRFAAMA